MENNNRAPVHQVQREMRHVITHASGADGVVQQSRMGVAVLLCDNEVDFQMDLMQMMLCSSGG